jgi:hypothetical protein
MRSPSKNSESTSSYPSPLESDPDIEVVEEIETFVCSEEVAPTSSGTTPVESDLDIEVAEAIDAIVGLEEIDPNLNPVDVLADYWGIPSPNGDPKETGIRSRLKKLNLPWFR